MVERLQISEVDQQAMAQQREELTSRLQEALKATAFSNRFLLPPRRLPQIAKTEADAFLNFLKTGDADKIREQGVKRAKEGLGEQAILRLGTTLRQFCQDHLADKALRAADVYTNTLLEGFMRGREAIVLREQEEIRRALQRAISHYALQIATATEVSRAASSILDPARLLPQVVDLIHDRFNFYYVGLFLLDESGEYAVLRAGTGEAGHQMLDMGHKLKVGGDSMVGWCTAKAQARIALDVGRDAVRFDNPLLPGTRSEMALPLISQGRVIGAMTIQSEKPAAFSEEDIAVLQTMADQLANAIQTANSIILRIDTEGRVTFFNEFAQNFFGYAEDEILGQSVVGTIVPERDISGRDLAAMIQDIVQNPGRYTTNENEHMRENGERVWVAWTNKAILDDDGRVAEILSIGTDITARKRAEEALRESEDRYRDLVEHSRDLICTHDLEGRFLSGNQEPARILGYDKSTLMNMNIRDILAPEVRDELDTYLATIQRDGVASGLMLVQTSTGERRIWEYHNTLRTEGVAEPIVRGMARDITERRQAEAEREQLLTALERRSTQLQTAAEVSKAASTVLDSDELLAEIVYLICDRFDLYYVGIFLVDETGGYAVLRAGTGEAGLRMLKAGYKLKVGGKSMVGWCTANVQARIALDVGRDAVHFDNPLLPETRSEMALPLISRGQVIGAMTIQSTQPAAFSDEDIAVFQTVADQLANAIENARLFEEAMARTQEVTALAETGRKLASTLELDAVLDTIMDACLELFQIRQASFIMMDKDGYLRMRRHRGLSEEFVRSIVGRPGEGFYGKVYQSGEAILVQDAREQLDPATAKAVLQEGITSFVHAPVRVKGETVAMLNLTSSQEDRRFSERDLERLSAFVDQAAIAVENARLFEETQAALAEIAALYQAGRRITAAEAVEDILQAVQNHIVQPHLDRILIALFDPDVPPEEPVVVVSAIWDRDPALIEALRGRRVTVSEVPMIATLDPDTTIVVNNVDTDEQLDGATRFFLQSFNVKSAIALPITAAGEHLGWMFVGTTRGYHTFNEEELRPYQTILGQVAVTIQSIRRLEETQTEARQARALYEASQLATRLEAGLESALSHLFETVAGPGNFDRWWIGLAREEAKGPALHTLAVHIPGLPPEMTTQPISIIPETRNPFAIVFQQGETIVINQPPDMLPHQRQWVAGKYVATPIRIGGEVVGALSLGRPLEGRDLGARAIALAETIATQVSIALENRQLFEETLKRMGQTQLLLRVSEATASALESMEVMRRIAREIAQALDADMTGAYLLDETGKKLQPIAGYHVPPERLEMYREFCIPVEGHPFAEEAWQSRRTVFTSNTVGAPRFDEETCRLFPAQSVLLTPMIVKDEIVGGLWAVWWEKARHFTEEEQRLVEGIVRQAAVAIENAQLFEAEAQRRREAETLRQAAVALTSTLDLEKALDLILEQLHRVVAYDSASVHLLQDGHLEIVGGRGFADPSAIIGLCFPVPGDNPNTRVIESGEPVILADAQAAHAPFREPPHDHIRSWLGVPMRFRERTIGMIALDSKELGYFTADHARLATAFASQATVAVENARLFEQEQARAERERLVRTITDRVRRSTDTEAIMRTTLQELGQMLGASQAIIRLGTQAQLCPDGSTSSPQRLGEGLLEKQKPVARKTEGI